jgi:glutamate synthase (NADPH/NADH)
MRAREGVMQSDIFGEELEMLYPIVEDGGSDSAAFDNVLELLTINGVLSLPEAVMLMVPEAWQGNTFMDPKKAAFYEWAACQMEPWDGPALFTFADGRFCGANLDRNGLRPCRFYVMDDDRIICASEVGTIPVDPERIVQKGRLQPGRMLLVDTQAGRIIDDSELKTAVSSRHDFRAWLDENLVTMPAVLEKVSENKDVALAAKPDDTKVCCTLSATPSSRSACCSPPWPRTRKRRLALWATMRRLRACRMHRSCSMSTSASSSLK